MENNYLYTHEEESTTSRLRDTSATKGKEPATPALRIWEAASIALDAPGLSTEGNLDVLGPPILNPERLGVDDVEDATISDDEDELQMDFSLEQSGGDAHNLMGMGFGLPTESERSLMERVIQELKIKLKQGFRSRIEDMRKELLRKKRTGKILGDTTIVLKNWSQQHSKCTYPTQQQRPPQPVDLLQHPYSDSGQLPLQVINLLLQFSHDVS
ncbi:Homeobox protein knotted-1-like 3 [Capsicum annuum]|nr:Homeobox protein knotted-1-like 3 [Capsicum annuum]